MTGKTKLAALVPAAVFLLIAVGAAKAECPPADMMTYQLAAAPKALAAGPNKKACFTFSGTDTVITDVINEALARCETATRGSCRIVTFYAPSAGGPVVSGSDIAVATARFVAATDAVNEAAAAATVSPAQGRSPACRPDRIPFELGDKPVRVNPYGFCLLTIWHRRCIYLRQAGETNTLGPLCPYGDPGNPPDASVDAFLPDNVEWIWSAQQPFTAYVQLASPESAVDPRQFVGSDAWRALCAKKYKSFEWYTGLYLAESGRKRVCHIP